VKISSFVVGDFQENCYLVVDEESQRAALIDPGAEGESLVAEIRATGARLEAIWLTHAHLDHIGGIAAIERVWDVPVYMHPDDLPVFEYGPRAAQMYGVPFELPAPPDRALADGDTLSLGVLRFAVMHAPGHAPGHVVIHGHGVAFVGDCLFAGSVGRTDLPLSDGAALTRSLMRIASLPPDTVALPGHGPETTIAAELATNPFLTGLALPVRR
jgi:hydroxyacylglutathione hydrolase